MLEAKPQNVLPRRVAVDPMPSISICLCVNEGNLDAVRKEYTVDLVMLNHDAQTTWLETSGDAFAVVYIPEELKKKKKRPAIDALISHESTHVVQRYFDWLGEKTPAEEERAYATGAVMQELVLLYWKDQA